MPLFYHSRLSDEHLIEGKIANSGGKAANFCGKAANWQSKVANFGGKVATWRGKVATGGMEKTVATLATLATLAGPQKPGELSLWQAEVLSHSLASRLLIQKMSRDP